MPLAVSMLETVSADTTAQSHAGNGVSVSPVTAKMSETLSGTVLWHLNPNPVVRLGDFLFF